MDVARETRTAGTPCIVAFDNGHFDVAEEIARLSCALVRPCDSFCDLNVPCHMNKDGRPGTEEPFLVSHDQVHQISGKMLDILSIPIMPEIP